MGFRDIDLNPKRISLPPLVTLPHCQIQMVTNVAMSSSSPEKEDCIVAVKFLGPQLSFFRPNSEWIDVRIQNPSFFSSHVIYSKKDDLFRIPGSGGHLIASWNLHKNGDKPSFRGCGSERFPSWARPTKRFWIRAVRASTWWSQEPPMKLSWLSCTKRPCTVLLRRLKQKL